MGIGCLGKGLGGSSAINFAGKLLMWVATDGQGN